MNVVWITRLPAPWHFLSESGFNDLKYFDYEYNKKN